MEDADLRDLRRARHLLDNPGLAIELANHLGRPVEWGLEKLPARAHDLVVSSTRKAMEAALGVAIRTMDGRAQEGPGNWRHRLAVIATGAAGGAFGLAGLPLELPISTTIMLRSVAAHARAQGEDVASPETRMNCILVLALGGPTPSDDAADVGYFAVRTALARAVADAAQYLAERALVDAAADRGAPAIARLVAAVASRFAPRVADKVVAQLAPALGAVGGAAINTLFIDHYQDMAWGHFTIRRLERTYGAGEVRRAYEAR